MARLALVCVLLTALSWADSKFAPIGPYNITQSDYVDFEPRIVNGYRARPGQFPFQVSLRYVTNGAHTCGGVVISPRYVMTAHHCIGSVGLYIVVGTNKLNSGGTRYDILRYILHSEYNMDDSFVNDIALLLTTRNIAYNQLVQPAYLPAQAARPGTLLTVSGWGALRYQGAVPNDLQCDYNYPVIGESDCRNAHGFNVRPVHLCAGNRRGKGICQGDSGGPISYQNVCYGLSSFVYIPCGSAPPDVFTNVFTLKNWIIGSMGRHAKDLRFA